LKKGTDPTDIRPFQIVVAYAPVEGGVITTDLLDDVEFLELEKTIKTEDLNMEIELPLIIGEVKYNI